MFSGEGSVGFGVVIIEKVYICVQEHRAVPYLATFLQKEEGPPKKRRERKLKNPKKKTFTQ